MAGPTRTGVNLQSYYFAHCCTRGTDVALKALYPL